MIKNKKHLFSTSLGLSAFIIVASLFTTLLISSPSYAQGADGGPGGGAGGGNVDDRSPATDEGVTCAIEKMGWILCPIIETAGKIGDQSFQFLSKTFLETEPELISNDEHGTKNAWELARNLANIMFIIVFLVIIYSQVTGAGVSNYGIKKMLPKLVVAALAVNLSYYICQLAVDFTNVLGYELQNFLVNVSKQISEYSALPPAGSWVFGDDSPGTLETIITAVLGLAAVIWFVLPFLFMGIGTVVITCIVIITILLLRKAIIIILIVAAPIAFVLYLLPNTEKYFKQWASMFWKLLLVFPVVGLLMGGGQLASAIVLTAGSNGEKSIYADSSGKCVQLPRYVSNGNPTPARTGACEGTSTPFMLGLVAAMIAVAPLLAVWSVLKAALNGAGALGGKIAGSVETYTRKSGEWGTKNTAIGRGMAARQAIKQNYKGEKFARKMSGSSWRGRGTRLAARGISGNAGMVAGAASSKAGQLPVIGAVASKGINYATGSIQAQNTKLAANFAGAALKIQQQDVQDKKAQYNDAAGDPKRLADILEKAIINGDEAGAKAAQEMLFDAGEAGAEAFRNKMENMNMRNLLKGNVAFDAMQTHISNNQSAIKSSNADIYKWAGEKGASISSYASAAEGITDAQVGTQSHAALKAAINAGAVDSDRAARILHNKDVAKDIKGKQFDELVRLAGSKYDPTR